jgi:hypothetical protein
MVEKCRQNYSKKIIKAKTASAKGERNFQARLLSWSTLSLGSDQRIQIINRPRIQHLESSQKKEGSDKISKCGITGTIELDPPRNRYENVRDNNSITAYSPRKKIAQRNPLYSV